MVRKNRVERVTCLGASAVEFGGKYMMTNASEPTTTVSLATRLPELDAVRGLAIVLVLLWHYGACQLEHNPGTALNFIRQALGICWSGVDLFFVLSGFLIGGILIENRESRNYFRVFYLRRACRIFPLYYGWLAIAGVLFALGWHHRVPTLFADRTPFWSYLTYTQNFFYAGQGTLGSPWLGVTWSLAVEEQFYLLLPLFVRVVSAERLPYWLVWLVLAAPVFRLCFWYFMPNQGAGFVLLPCRWDSLLMGVLGASLVRKPGFIHAVRRNERFLYILLGVIAAGVTILRVTKQGYPWSFGTQMMGFLWLAVFYLVIIILSLYSGSHWMKRPFRVGWLQRIGGISYAVYLFHQPVSWLFHQLLWKDEPRLTTLPRFATTCCALACTLLLASVSWRVFESKCVSWGRGFTYRARVP